MRFDKLRHHLVIPCLVRIGTINIVGLPAVFASELADNKRPNIVLVLTDDQPYGYLGVTGNNIAKTPNIDKLADQGVLFTNAHVTSAICMPSRVSIVLSQYERKHGVNFNSGTAVSAEAQPVVCRQ